MVTFASLMTIAKSLLMIRPAAFGFNTETAASNSFQQNSSAETIRSAQQEFDRFVLQLREHQIAVRVFDDTEQPVKPDAVFPNNWFSTHENGVLVLYPMAAQNRRTERRSDITEQLKNEFGYRTVHDLSYFEKEEKFLEGTGSIVFDHEQKIAYAAFSPRTDKDVLLQTCELLGYLPLVFTTAGKNGQPVYHTNVLMALQPELAVVCPDCIPLADDRRAVLRMLEISGKTILSISISQLEAFAGNMLFVKNASGKTHVLLSQSAWNSLEKKQQETFMHFAQPIIAAIPVIEKTGGGSVRCMVAELY